MSTLIYILKKVTLKHYHHQWLDSPGWALAFLRCFFHLSLSLVCLLQLISPIILLLSRPILSSHLIFGFTIPFSPSGLAKSILFEVHLSFIRVTLPAHCNLLILMLLPYLYHYIFYIRVTSSPLTILLHFLKMHVIILSKEQRASSSLLSPKFPMGSTVTTDGALEDVHSRIKKINGTLVQLYPVWRNKNILVRTKIRLFNTNVKSFLF
jgi:hypothetical protein